MQRWDVINHLIKKNNYKSYLEIGYYKGWSFDRVECERKTAVDPNPCKTPEQEAWGSSSLQFLRIGVLNDEGSIPVYETLYKCDSDHFFKEMIVDMKGNIMFKYDIIFIDGLHKSEQADKDVQNSLKHLSPGGCIIMHDVNPPTEAHLTGTPSGEWCGDTYKSFIRARKKYWTTHYGYTVDTDYGIGVFKQRDKELGGDILMMWGSPKWEEDWEHFQKQRNNPAGPLGLISVERFLEMEKI